MALSRQNPLSIEAVGEIQVDLEDQIRHLSRRIEDAEQARSTWITKQKRLLEQRRGVRQKKVIPWPGSNNDNWPVTDAVIRRWKPAMANLVVRSEPVALFDAKHPDFIDQSKLAQEFYHWLFNIHIDRTHYTVYELVDLIAQHGKAYTRQGWDYRTERHSRVVLVDSLFPEGIEPALNSANQKVAEANQRLAENQRLPELDAQTFVMGVLAQQYGLDARLPNDGQMLVESSGRILEGAQYVRLLYQQVVADKPAWGALSPLDVVLPPRSEGVHNADFVTVIHRMSRDDILQRVRDGFFNEQAAMEAIERIGRGSKGDTDSSLSDVSGRRRSLTQVLDAIEGIDEHFEELIPSTQVWEIYTRIDIDGDGIAERVVIWYHHPSKSLLSIFEYPYPFREWPIVEFHFEYNSKRPFGSRGIAEMLSVHQKQVNMIHNSRLDAAQITLAPMFKVRSVGQQFARNVKFRPGARIPVTHKDDIDPIVMDMRPIGEFQREENFTKQLAEQYVGIFDPSLTQLGASGRERRTATEVDAVVAQSSETQSQDAQLFQLGMAQVHKQIWDLWEEYGPNEVHFRVTGEEQPKTARKIDISGEFEITPAGSPVSTNRAIVLQRAREMLQFFAQDQTGLVNKEELYKEYFSAQDYQLSRRIVRDVSEAQLIRDMIEQVQQLQEANGAARTEPQAF